MLPLANTQSVGSPTGSGSPPSTYASLSASGGSRSRSRSGSGGSGCRSRSRSGSGGSSSSSGIGGSAGEQPALGEAGQPAGRQGEPPFFGTLDIVRHPLPGCGTPAMVAFAPDNSSLTYLYSADSLSRHLCKFDLATRREEVLVRAGVQPGDERALSMAERLRRERSRELGHGLTRYEWVKGTMQLLLPLPGGPAIFSLVDSSLRTLARASYERPVLDPQVRRGIELKNCIWSH